MAKYVVKIKRVEIFQNAVVVEAEDSDAALKKVEEKWQEDDYLYEKTTDDFSDCSTDFYGCRPATEQDIKWYINID